MNDKVTSSDKAEKAVNQDEHNRKVLFGYYDMSINDIEIWALLRDDLCRIAIKEHYRGAGIYKLLNRILVVFQLPTKLTIYKKVNREFEFKYTTATDPVYRDDFLNYSRSLLDDDEWHNSLIQIYDTDYYLLPTWLCKSDDLNDPFIFKHYPNDKAALNIVRAVFDARLTIKNSLFKQLRLADYWQENLENSFDSYSPEIEDTYPKTVPQCEWNPSKLSYIANSILEGSYAKHCDSQLLAGSTEISPPNICYFSRTFDRSFPNDGSDTARYGHYNYQIRMVIPESQEKHFKRAFAEIRTSLMKAKDHGKDSWRFGEREFSYFHHHNSSDFEKLFIDVLAQENGIEEVIKILRMPYSRHTRSFVDPVIRSGFTDIRRNPFQNAKGLDWIAESDRDNNETLNDKIRIVALYYLFCTMLPKHPQKNPQKMGGQISCLIKPLRGDFGSCLAFVHVSEFYNVEDEQLTNLQRYRQFYYGVAVLQGRRIREAMFNLYLDEISDIIQQGMKELLKNVDEIKEKQSIDSFISSANQQFENLCGIYPYHKVEISFLNNTKEHHQNQISFFGLPDKHIAITLKENPAFPPVIGFSPPDRSALFVKATEHGLYQVAINYNFSKELKG